MGRTLVYEHRYAEAEALLERALEIQERVYGNVHPPVASALNELGKVAEKERKLDQAQSDFARMAEIYRKVYGDKHDLLGIALSNRGNVYMDRKEYARAERLYRQAIALFTETLSPNHLNTGIARIKLGSALVGERRFAEAETESLAGYEILIKQTSPSVSWLQNARADLVTECEALHQSEMAHRFGTELANSAGGNRRNSGKSDD